jgi:hypothetical protein
MKITGNDCIIKRESFRWAQFRIHATVLYTMAAAVFSVTDAGAF